MSINKDLVAASSTPLVLAILAEGNSYGYAILKRVRELSSGGVLRPPDRARRLRDGVPQRGRGVVQPEVHVAVLGEGGEDLEPGGGEPAGSEDREPVGQVA